MDYRGQQIFIIHPDKQIREDLVRFLRYAEYETFGLEDTDPANLVNRYDSVVFLYAGAQAGWHYDVLLSSLHDDGKPLKLVALGTDALPEKFDRIISASGENLKKRVLLYLQDIDAQGHRHFVRFGSQNASIATFEFHREGKRYAGVIHNISVAGMSCTFKPEPETEKTGHITVPDMQLNLPGHRSVVPGRLTTHRVVAGQIIHVFHFFQDISSEIKDGIYDFIYTSLETKLSRY